MERWERRNQTRNLVLTGPQVNSEAEDLSTWPSWHMTTSGFCWKDWHLFFPPFFHAPVSHCIHRHLSQTTVHTLLDYQSTHTVLNCRDKPSIWSNRRCFCENIFTVSVPVHRSVGWKVKSSLLLDHYFLGMWIFGNRSCSGPQNYNLI